MRLLLLLALVLAVVGCGRPEQAGAPDVAATAAAKAPPTPRDGGELVFAFDGTAAARFGLDPHKAQFAPHQRVLRSIYDSLVVALPNQQFGPWLATSWRTSADGRQVTFELRDDVRFHDGTRFDAEAVKYNIERIRAPENLLGAASDLGPVESATVEGEFTVRLNLREPYQPLLANLSKSTLAIVSPAAARRLGAGLAQQPVGSGPFRYVSQQPGTEVVLERNADYRWAPAGALHEGPARLERVVFKNVPEEATRIAVLQSGQAQAADIIPSQHLAALRDAEGYGVVLGELLNHNFALFPNLRRAPWNDERMRRALKLSLDLDAAVRTVHLGVMPRAWSVLSPSIPGYDRTLEGSWRPDAAEAARLLDELGWVRGADGVRTKDGKRLTIVFLGGQGNREKRLDLLTVLRRQLRTAGFEMRLDDQPVGTYIGKVEAGDYDVLAGSLFDPDPDVLRRLYTPALRARTSYTTADDPALNRLLEDGAREADPLRRAGLYARAQHLIDERVYAIPTYVMLYSIGHAAHVHDLRIDVHGFPWLHDAWVSR